MNDYYKIFLYEVISMCMVFFIVNVFVIKIGS